MGARGCCLLLRSFSFAGSDAGWALRGGASPACGLCCCCWQLLLLPAEGW